MIIQLYGEWTGRSDTVAGYEKAVAGCPSLAYRHREHVAAGGRKFEHTMVDKGLALYIDVPHHLLGFDDSGARGIAEIKPNNWDGGFLTFEVGGGRHWTDGLVTAPESVLWQAIHAYWSVKVPEYEGASARERQAYRRGRLPSATKGVPTIEDLSGLIDYNRCRQSGPVLVAKGWSMEFEEPDGRGEELPFLVALSDPLRHPAPLTGPYGSGGDRDETARLERIRNQDSPMRMGRRRWPRPGRRGRPPRGHAFDHGRIDPGRSLAR
ncbi:hypothetical protein [Embleya sp. NPDC005971]|uniref:hypothetical protein n=1 Tax=unclassified Embleya TaxID=2699296 RepID=UPI0033F1455C